MHGDEVIVLLRRLQYAVAADAVLRSCEKLARAYKANFDPNQPRVPAGNPDGGQWTSTGGSTGGGAGRNDPRVLSDAMPDDEWISGAQYAQNTPRPPRGGVRPVLINGRWVQPTTAQSMRLAAAELRADAALWQVRRLDPNWRPRPSAYESVEGLIQRTDAAAREAQVRYDTLRSGIGGNFGPPLTPSTQAASGAPATQRIDGPTWIAAYRTAHDQRDMYGHPIGLREKDTVAVAESDGRIVFGVNSGAVTHSFADRLTAQRYVDALVSKYPDIMSVDNLGQIPNDALYHAESTLLLRAAGASDGTLRGQAIVVHVDREMCDSCTLVLPKLGLELGNPTVTFVDKAGTVLTMRGGKWDE